MFKKIRIIDIVAGFLVIGVFWSIYAIYTGGVYNVAGHRLNDYTEIVIEYMKQNKGQLPGNLFMQEKIQHMENFNFKLAEGLGFENIEKKGSKLFDKKTGKQIFIIEGNRHWLAKKAYNKLYEEATVQVYNEMMKYKINQINNPCSLQSTYEK